MIDERAFGLLQKQVAQGKWATTYLFTGEEVAKKKALAIAFAKALNCANARAGLKPAPTCDCSVCARIENGTYPDVKWYGLDEEASSIKISEVRDFKNWLALKPYEARVKVFIFQGADRLTAEAQNALLKSLEEPPPGNVILLLVEHARNLFDTIVSRSIEIKVPPFTGGEIREIFLKEGTSPEEAEFLARVSHGNLDTAREAREESWLETRKKWIENLSRDPFSFLGEFQNASRSEAGRVFDFLIEWIRDLLIFQASRDSQLLIHPDFIIQASPFVKKNEFRDLLNLFQSIMDLRKALDENANQKLTLTQAGILLERFLHD